MVISYFGLGFVKIQLGERVVVFNPIGKIKEIKGFRPAKFGADLALVSLLGDEGYNGVEEASRGDRRPVVIDGPGEYEIGNIFIKGFASAGPRGLQNTIYLLVWDEIRLAHLGALAQADLGEQVGEELAGVDVLFIPIAGPPLIDYQEAAKISAALEPKIIIPVNFSDGKTLNQFLKETGGGEKQPQESLVLKKKDLSDKESAIVVVKSF